ncbi:GNAT family N-acetyltransferase, partial [Pseudomonas aeruginosa]|nr:GNAT family N-acetyltransferase [Pseudomonas aeruginosa]
MTAESPTIRLERYSERHVEGLTALYNDPAVARQVLQMPYQSVEQRRKRLHDSVDDDRLLILVALHQGDVIGSASLEQHPRIRRSHSGSIGLGVAVAWQGKGVGSRLLGELLDIADNWMNLRRVELTVYTDNAPALALYRKFGFETEGEMRDYAVRDGRFVDVYSMARLRRVEGRVGAVSYTHLRA